MIEKFYKKLKSLTDLKPKDEVNNVFSELCKYVVENDKKLKVNKKILEINEICSKAEFEMEKFYSKKIANSQNPKQELKNFIYYQNYEKLTKLEFLNASFFEENIKEVLFVGWGPLPLTAIILATNFQVNCKIVDYSEEAINLGERLIESLNLKEKISFVEKDILEYKDEKNYDLVYVASLVFGNDFQDEILKNISNLNFKKLLTRTSHGTRKLLYKKIKTKNLKKYFKKELIVHPKNEIINSFIILSKKENV